jgi:hypothetical protein
MVRNSCLVESSIHRPTIWQPKGHSSFERPLFHRGEGRADEGFPEIDYAAVAQIFREPQERAVETSGALSTEE